MPPRVSVIIPAYQHEAFILDTLESVFRQTLPPLEVIVVNDGSPDGTEARLAPLVHAGRIRYVQQANAGQAAARNRGAALARGDLLAFLDDDDLWPPDSLAWRAAALAADESLIAVHGLHRPIRTTPVALDEGDATGTPDDVRVERLPPWHFLLGNRIRSPGQVLVRRRAFEAIGGFDASIWGADDWDLWLRLSRLGTIAHGDRVALFYREHHLNASRHSGRMCDACLRIVARNVAAVASSERPLVRYLAYRQLSAYLDHDLRANARAAIARRAWPTVYTEVSARLRLRLALASSAVGMKLRLLRERRWRLQPSELEFRTPVRGSEVC